ncbi:hydroxyacylglutathione hydrolase [Thalassotalea crassostreae]|uniref:hydroxyacylglutathione hydrolase n=1 Tax=Thalassotalea crassostreae TaxID=1763536 RepID=UPI000838F5C0|nr:hydroxyacylglutathione hydrolase [Thalassotalea crassostreae]
MLTITAIPAFNDNYIWCLTSSASSDCALVDPGDADVCIEFIKKNKLNLTTILITHHHHDHVGGVKQLKQFAEHHNQSLTIYGPAKEAQSTVEIAVNEGDNIEVLDKYTFNVVELPGHTLGHIAYYDDKHLFCGDTMFSGGCGRLFEGTPAQMLSSLNKLAALPAQTKVYCAHEYTLANLKFARTIEPNNSQLTDYYEKVLSDRAQGISTIPTTIEREKLINPFVRCQHQEVIATAQQKSSKLLQNDVDVFAIIRQLKDNF